MSEVTPMELVVQCAGFLGSASSKKNHLAVEGKSMQLVGALALNHGLVPFQFGQAMRVRHTGTAAENTS